MDERKKICLIIPTLNAGGMERVMSLLANHLIKRGHLTTIVLLKPNLPFFEIEKEAKLLTPQETFTNNLISAIKLFKYIRNRVKTIDPDVILSFGERYNSYVLLSLTGTKYPVYISDRSSPKKKLSSFYLWLSKILYPTAAGIICQTKIAQKLLSERIDKKHLRFQTIPNPIREIYSNKEVGRENIILLVGRLVIEKRYDRLFEIIDKISLEKWRIIVVGDGPLLKYLQDEIAKRDLSNIVILAGNVRDVDNYFQRAKIFALTSDSEGFPNSLTEAMAHGLACISFDCIAGPSEIITNNKNGILIEDGNIDDYAYNLKRLMDDDELSNMLGNEAKKIRDTLNSSKILSLYEKTLIEGL